MSQNVAGLSAFSYGSGLVLNQECSKQKKTFAFENKNVIGRIMSDLSFWLHLLTQYGYIVVVAGAFFEGESVLLLAGALAHEGYFSLPLIALCALVGSLGSDQLMFFIGRRYGSGFLEKRPRLQRASERIAGLVGSHENALILCFRFVWGIRNATPIMLGARGVDPWKFCVLNALGAAVWSALFSVAGYYLGEALERFFGGMQMHHHLVLALLLGLALLGGIAACARNRSQTRSSD